MKKKLLLILVILLFISLAQASQAQQINLTTLKTTYSTEESIIIYLSDSELTGKDITNQYEIKLLINQKPFKYMGEIIFPLELGIKKIGTYQVQLIEKKSNQLINAIDLEIKTKEQIEIEEQINQQNQIQNIYEEIQEKNKNLILNSTNNSCENIYLEINQEEIKINEKTEIKIINKEKTSQKISLIINSPNRKYRFLETENKLYFVPEEIGIYKIDLLCNDNIIAQTNFSTNNKTNLESSTPFLVFFQQKIPDDVDTKIVNKTFQINLNGNTESITDVYIIDFFNNANDLIKSSHEIQNIEEQDNTKLILKLKKTDKHAWYAINNYETQNNNIANLIITYNGINYTYEAQKYEDLLKKPIRIMSSEGQTNRIKYEIINTRQYKNLNTKDQTINLAQTQTQTKYDLLMNLNQTIEENTTIMLEETQIPEINTELRIEKLQKQGQKINGEEILKSYAMDLSNLDFTKGTFTTKAKGKQLFKCKDWNYSSQQCLGTWKKIKDLIPGQEYEIIITPEDPGYIETTLTILNVKSNPLLNNYWTINFTTIGKENIIIKPISQTTWRKPNENNPADLEFTTLTCGQKTIIPTWNKNTIDIENYECNETSQLKIFELTEGKHTMYFQFGNDSALAFNDASGWYNQLWEKCKDINITNFAGQILYNYTTLLKIPYDSQMQSDYEDLRFTDQACGQGGQEIGYDIETYNSTEAMTWVRIPTLNTSGTTISMYYSNPTALNGENEDDAWRSDYGIVYHMDSLGLDSSGNGNDRTADDGTPTSTNTILGYGITFNGSTAWDMTNIGYWESSFSERTHEVIFETSNNVSGRQTILAEGGGTNGLMLYILDGIIYSRWWSEGGAVNMGGALLNTTISPNSLYYLTMTYNNETNYTLYINKTRISFNYSTDIIDAHGGNGGIGYTGPDSKDFEDTAGQGYYFKGTIHELRAQDKELTWAEINQTYENIFNNTNSFTIGSAQEVPTNKTDITINIYDMLNNSDYSDDILLNSITYYNESINGGKIDFGRITQIDSDNTYRIEIVLNMKTDFEIDADYFKETFIKTKNNVSFSTQNTTTQPEFIIGTSYVPTDGYWTQDIFYSQTVNSNYTNSAVGEFGYIDGDPDIVAIYNNDLKVYQTPQDTYYGGDWTEYVANTDVGTISFDNKVVLADIDRDGYLDAFVANDNEDIRAYQNPKDPFGTTWTERMIDSSLNARDVTALAAGDLDNDGWIDVCGGIEARDDIYCFQNDGTPWDADWVQSTIELAAGGDLEDIVIADINRDGLQDIIASVQGVNDITWWENDGTPWDGVSWTPRDIDTNTGQLSNVVKVVDLDLDGDLDVVQGDDGGDIAIYENNGSNPPGFTKYLAYDGPGGEDIVGLAIADINDDGKPDIIYGAESANDVEYLENSGTPWSTGWTSVPISTNTGSTPWTVEIADIDKNGYVDVIVGNNGAEIIAYFNNGTPSAGEWNSNILESAAAGSVYSIAIGDLDKDNYSNILEFYYNATENFENGTGTFSGQTTLSQGNHTFNFIITPDNDFGINKPVNTSFFIGSEQYDGWKIYEEKAALADIYPIRITWEVLVNYVDVIPPNISFIEPPTPINGLITENKNQNFLATINETNLKELKFEFNNINTTQYSENLVLMMNLDNESSLTENNNFVKDLSKYSNDGDPQGQASPTTGVYGGAYTFDGSGDYIQIESDSTLDIQNFTFTTWFKTGPSTSWTSYPSIIMRGDGGAGNELYIGFSASTQDTIVVILDGSIQNFDGNVDLIDQQWHHLTVTYDSTTISVYIDGEQYANNVSLTRTLNFGGRLYLGLDTDALDASFGNYWNGQLDEIRLWNTTFNPTTINEWYTSNLKKYNDDEWNLTVNKTNLNYGTYDYKIYATDHIDQTINTTLRNLTISPDTTYPQINFIYPTPENATGTYETNLNIRTNITEENILSLIYNWNGTNITIYNNSLVLQYNYDKITELGENDSFIVDTSIYKNNGTLKNDARYELQGKYNRGVYFDGTGDYVEILSDTALDVQDFTYMTWFKTGPNTSWTSYPSFFMRGDSGTSNELFIAINDTDNDSIAVMLDNTIYSTGSGTNLIDQQWHHLAVTYDSSTIKVYLDGEQYGNNISAVKTLNFGTSNAWIGTDTDTYNGNFGNYWNGTFDESRLWNVSLDAQSINKAYNSNLEKTGNQTWILNTYENNLGIGTYTFQTFIEDTGTNTNTTGEYSVNLFETGVLDYDEAADISIAALDDFTVAIAWIDQNSYNASFEIWQANKTRLVDKTTFEFDGNANSRISITPISSTQFAIGIIDGPESDLDIWIYDVDGNEILSRTELDNNLASFTDVSLTPLTDRFIVCNANDADNDADYRIISLAGTDLYGEQFVDGNMNPEALSQNLISCSSIGDGDWVYSWYDDGSNDISFAIVNETNTIEITETDLDLDVGETAQVAMTGLTDKKFAIAYYDSNDDNIYLSIRQHSPYGLVTVLDKTLDTNLGGDTKLALSEINKQGISEFVVAWQKNGAITTEIYDDIGNIVTPKYNITLNSNINYQLIGLESYHSPTTTGLCSGTFVIGYTNDENKTVFSFEKTDGTEWDGGSCDNTPPNITFVDPTLPNGTVSNLTTVYTNISINESELGLFKFQWEGQNTTIYNESLIIGFNFDKETSIGETNTNLHDISIYQNNGTLNGGEGDEYTANGKHNGAYDLDGFDDLIETNDISEIDSAEELTISAWIKVDDLNDDGTIIAKDDFVSNPLLLLYRDETGKGGRTDAFTAIISDGTTNATLTTTTSSSNDNNWHHIAMTFKAGSTQGLRIYIDGQEDPNSNVSTIGISNLNSNSYTLRIGAPHVTLNKNLDGSIDELMIYNRELTSQEITELYKGYLKKYDTDKYYYFSNHSNLIYDTYSFKGYSEDIIGNPSETDLRSTILAPDPFAPEITFVPPTYSDGALTTDRFVPINVSIKETNLANVLIEWNNTNQTLMDNSLVLIYNFDNISDLGENNSYVKDNSPNNLQGTIYGTPYFNNSGKYYGSIKTGTGNFVRNDYVSEYISEQNFTILMWTKKSSSTPQQFILGINSNNGVTNRLLLGHQNAQTNMSLYDENEGWVTTNANINDDEWHQIGLRYDVTTGNMSLIYDGQFIQNYTSSVNIATDDRFVLGAEYDGASAGDYWQGHIDELKVFSRSLTKEEIQYNYNSNLNRLNSSYWILYSNQTNLTLGTYSYKISASDVPTSSTISETRTITIFDKYIIDYNQAIDIEMTPLDNTTIVYAWIDASTNYANFEIFDTNGTRIIDEITIDTDGGPYSRISVAAINTNKFVIALGDDPDDDLAYWIYDRDGILVSAESIIDTNIGVNFDLSIAELGDRFVICNANDNDNDADFRIYDNSGTDISGELNVDGNMNPDSQSTNYVDCASLGDGDWVYSWYDDNSNAIRVSARDENGTIYQTITPDSNIGEQGQIAVTGLRNKRFATSFFDDSTNEIQMNVYLLSGASIVSILANTVIDTGISASNIEIAEVEDSGESYFVIAWQDDVDGTIKAATYDDSGIERTAPFNITTNPNQNYQLIDVAGFYSSLGFGLCDESFAIGITNSTNHTTFKTYNLDGIEWNGQCIIDTTPPNITLNEPTNGQTLNNYTVTFNWTATDNDAINMTCDLIIDDITRETGTILTNNTSYSTTANVGIGLHEWYVECTDEEANTGTSDTRTFTINILSNTNNVTLDRLGTLGTLIYQDTDNAGTPLQRNWTGTLGAEEILAPDLGAIISWQKFICSKINPECYLVAQETDNSIDFLVYNLETRIWHNQTTLTANRGLDDQRSFDIACEDDGVSEECLIIYETSTAANNEFEYRIWDGQNISSANTVVVTEAPNNDFRWVSLYPQKGTNTIGLVVQNDAGARNRYSMIWNGDNNSIINQHNLSLNAAGNDRKQYDCAWEGSSGKLICAYGENTDDLFAKEYNPSTQEWSYIGNIYPALGAQAREVTLCGETPYTSDFTHDYIGIMTCDQDEDRDGGIWDGNTFSKAAIGDTPSQDTASECDANENNPELYSQACAFERSGDQIIFTWVDANENFPEGGTYTISSDEWSFTTWGDGIPIGISGTDDVEEIQLIPNPVTDEIFLIDQDASEELSCAIWTGRAFTATDCGDYELTGPATAQGAYISYDWIRFDSQPRIIFNEPLDERTYTYSGITTNTFTHEAYYGATLNLPGTPPLTTNETNNSGYTAMSIADNNYFTTTITTTGGERAYQNFKFEIQQTPDEIGEIKIFHEGYATATTFQTQDTYYFYIYNHTSDNYVLLKTNDNTHAYDIFTEIKIQSGFSDFIQDGNLYILIEGNHQTGGGGNARADIYTDYIELDVNSTPNINEIQTINIDAIDQNGIEGCFYNYENLTGTLYFNYSLTQINFTNFQTTSNTTHRTDNYYHLNMYCNDTFDKQTKETELVRIDNTVPLVNLIIPNESDYFSYSEVNFSFNATDNSDGLLSCIINTDGSTNITNILLDSGNTANETISGFSDGIHTWYAACMDVAGNWYTTGQRSFTTDAGAPTITLKAPSNNTITNNNNIQFNYTPDDAIGLSKCELIINGQLNQTNSTTIQNHLTNSFTINSMPDGAYNWFVNCTDLSNFTGSSETWYLTVDTTPPSTYLNTTSGIEFTNGSAQLNYTTIDLLDNSLICNISVDDEIKDQDITSSNNTLISRNLTLADGIKFWYVTCVDEAGNINISETRNFTLGGPPYIEMYEPYLNDIVSGTDTDFNFFVQDGDGVDNCSLYIDDTYNQTIDGGDLDNPGNNSFTVSNIAAGTHNWSIYCIDSTLLYRITDAINFTVDKTAPTITLEEPINGSQITTNPVEFIFTPNDNAASILTCSLIIDGNISTTNNNFNSTNNEATSVYETISNGNHNWSVTCKDSVENSNTSITKYFSLLAPLTVIIETNETAYNGGETAGITTNTTDESNNSINATTITDIIYTNTTITQAPWWNINWKERKPIIITENDNRTRTNDLIKINITNIDITNCQNEIRLVKFIQHQNTEIARNILSGDNSTYCEIEFYTNITQGDILNDTYFVYYNYSSAPATAPTISDNKVLNVQRDTITATGQILLDAVSTINPDNSFILFSANTGSTAPNQNQLTPNITSSTIIQFTRYVGTTSTDLSWQLIEHKDITAQRGEETITAGSTGTNVNISAVNLDNSFIIVYGRADSGSANNNHDGYFTAEFVDSDTIKLTRTSTTNDATVSWQVVEWPDINVQTGVTNFTTASQTAPINTINISRSFLIFGKAVSGDTGLDANHIRGKINSPSEIEFNRQVGQGSASVSWFVVELPEDSIVESGTKTITADTTQTLTNEFTLDQSFMIDSSDSSGGGTTYTNAMVKTNLNDSTTLFFDKETTSNTNYDDWFVMKPSIYSLITKSIGDKQVFMHQNITTTGILGTTFWNYSTAYLNEGLASAISTGTASGFSQGTDATSFTVTSDILGPTITLLSPEDDITYISQDLIFVYTAEDISTGVAECKLLFNGVVNKTETIISEIDNNEFEVLNISEGYYNWTVTCKDTYGNWETASPRDLYIDNTNPNVTAHNPNNETINALDIIFNFTVSDNFDDNLYCAVNVDDTYNGTGYVLNGTTGNISISEIGDGDHSWNVTCFDNANNNFTSETLNFTSDAPPRITLDTPIDEYGTTIGNVSFYYFVTDGTLQNCSILFDGSINQTKNSAQIPYQDGSNINNFTINNIAEGTHNWTIQCYDGNGFSSNATERTLYVDTQNPIINLTSPEENTTFYIDNIDFEFNVTDNIDPELSCSLYINDVINETGINATNGNITTVNVNGFLAGNYNWSIYCEDKALNNITSETRNFTISSDVIVSLENPYDNSTDGDGTVTFTYTPSSVAGFETGGFCELYIDGSSSQTDIGVNNGLSNTFISLTPMTQGLHTWQVKCTDDNVNSGQSNIWNIYIDLSDPVVSTHNPNGETYNVSTVEFNWTATDNYDNNMSCNIIVNGTTQTPSNISSINNTPTQQTYTGFTDGLHTYYGICLDNGDRTGISSTKNFNVQEPPTILLDLPLNEYRTNITNITFYYTPTDNSGNISSCEIVLDSTSNNTEPSPQNAIQNNLTVNNFVHGKYLWTINCTDPSGNEGTNITGRNITIDLVGPNITLNEPYEGQIYNYDDIIINWTPTDDYGTDITCDLTVDDTINASGITGNSGNDFTYLIENFSEGPHNWSVICRDDLYNYNTSITNSFIVNSPDLYINNSLISFNETNPDIGETIQINATIYNYGGIDAENALIEFWDGLPGTGTLIGNDTINITINESTDATTTWNITAGYHNVWVIADPYETMVELNDSNNNATTNISILMGNLTNPLNETWTSNANTTITFNLTDFTGSIINYTIYVDGSPSVYTGTVNDAESNQINITLSQGTRTIMIRATDSISRIKDSNIITRYVDLTNPSSVINTANETWYNYSTPEINFTINDNMDTMLNYTFYVNGSVDIIGNQTAAVPGKINLSTLVNGSYQIILEAKDEVNRTTNSTPIIIYVDTVAPTINLNAPNNSDIFIVNDVNLNFTITDNLAVGPDQLTCDLTLDGSVYSNDFTATSGIQENILATDLIEGNHYWNVTCTDLAGNTQTSETRNFTSVAVPVITPITPLNNTWINQGTYTFYFNATDETGLENCSLIIDGFINSTKTTAQLTNNATNNLTATGLNGTHTWAIECYDNSTFNAYDITETYTIYADLEAPQPIFITQNNTWLNSGPTLEFNITDNMDSAIFYNIYINGIYNKNGTAPNGFLTMDVPTGLINGTYNVTIEAIDEATNTANSTTIKINYDTATPLVTLDFPLETNYTQTSLDLNFTTSDNMAEYLMCTVIMDTNTIGSNLNVTNNSQQNVTVNNLAGGYHYWNVTCIDLANNSYTTNTQSFYIVRPDLTINNSEIYFNNSDVRENETINITATIRNIGTSDANNFVTQIWANHPDNSGTQIGTDFHMNLTAGNYTNISVTYTVPLGTTQIYVLVDTPTGSNGLVAEENESNNEEYKEITVESWHYAFGQTGDKLVVNDANNGTLFDWIKSNSSGSNLFAVDSDSVITWTQLQALGRDTSNNSQTGDFTELDIALGSENYTDNITTTFTNSGTPIETTSYNIFGKTINNIPMQNSTNNTNFKTGILWDYSDGGPQYSGTQDVLFMSQIKDDLIGFNATYDYEIRIPAKLREYTGATNTVDFYIEIR
ncbi:FG-GAP-like repeat-containing protein [Candidatus Woesearchaeota archaeon]|nr:FG-GAP-like repeat-containing protein [Candidatus Woesearchaeota archaeon]MCF8012944.1 FG-GAP-like repeat-containing protein [Candidatus Woesearchaeota archaeon]